MPNPLLLDSGFLYALFDEDDRLHKAASAVVETQGGAAIVPDVTLVEVIFLARRAGGIPAAIRFLDYFEQAGFELEALRHEDIRRVGTVDKRDFLIVRPAHVEHFELLPPGG